MNVLPAIDMRGGKVVRLYKGDYARQTTYGDDPLSQAKVFEDAGASWLHLVDLDGARSGQPAHLAQIQSICANTRLRVEVGGGIRNADTIDQLLGAGVTRVILGTAALRDWPWFESLMQRYPGQLVLGLDAREGKLAVAGWEQTTQTTALEIARRVTQWPLSAIVYTDIATDGTMKGPNIEATREVAEATKVPIIASGGVGSLDHLRALRPLPIEGVIIGRALYEGAFDLSKALSVIEASA